MEIHKKKFRSFFGKILARSFLLLLSIGWVKIFPNCQNSNTSFINDSCRWRAQLTSQEKKIHEPIIKSERKIKTFLLQ